MKKHAKHIALYPFSLLYGAVTGLRNWLFETELLPSAHFNIPIISVGNLAVGGTGKTPHTEFLLSFLQDEWKTAVLSRGYKRKTKGFQLGNENSNSLTLGDEPFQIYRKFPKAIISVDEKRVHGVRKLQALFPDLQLVLLDDAFQHRHIHPGLSVLLTDYANLYTRDLVLPAGRLREWHHGSKRANIIIVTKCPIDISPIEMRLIETELAPKSNQQLFFSSFVYDELKPVFPDFISQKDSLATLREHNPGVLLVAGIVSPQPIVEYLNNFSEHIETLFFSDHHAFQPKDITLITNKIDSIPTEKKILLVTEKDAARLQSDPNFPEKLKSNTYALPIRVEILNNQESLFIQKIKNYVVENSRNR